MNLIVLDTSSEHLILGVYVRQQLFSLDEPVGQKHAECILPSLAVLLERAGATLADINTIAFSSGPGGFTGLRIGCGIAQGLAVAHGLTLMPVPTLDIIAADFPDQSVYVCADARMGQVYSAIYTADRSERSHITLCAPEELPKPSMPCVGVGSGFAVYRDALVAQFGTSMAEYVPDARPQASGMLALALSGHYPCVPPEQAELLYVRNKIALTSRERAQKT